MIDHYDFGTAVVNGKEYTDHVICHKGKVSLWWRGKGHEITRNDLVEIVQDEPRVLVIGTGAYSRVHISEDARKYVAAHGIRLVAQPTGDAVRTFNELLEEGQDAAIAMHLTC